MSRDYQICKKCILDTKDDPEITFDQQGICNHCHKYASLIRARIKDDPEEIKKIISEIKNAGAGKQYDCIIGISGGVDSTYVAYLTRQLGLKPLAVHLDNGWNSELAVKNIENIVRKLGIDLYTYIINWEEFKDLQRSYFKASVIDIEIPTDHAIVACLYKIAREKNISFVLTGSNIRTEGFLPQHWIHNKIDRMNIRDIHRKYGRVKLKTFPSIGYIHYNYFTKIKSVPILDYVPYIKKEAKKIIVDELEWRDYGGKHYESIFTRFYQSYILPVKFGVDKRKSHLSTLICAGQLTREEALKEMENPPCPPEIIHEDKLYLLKKWGLTEHEFEFLMSQPAVPHMQFRSIINIYHRFRPLIRFFKKMRGG